MNAISINTLWSFIQSLNLTRSNKKWLADHLYESVESEKTAAQSKAETLAQIDKALKEFKLIQEGKLQARPVEELLNEL